MTKNKSRPFLLSIAGMLCAGVTIAQESVNASGGNGTGSGGFSAYSIGQVVYTTYTSSTGSSAQGVQHAYEILTLQISEKEAEISLKVFPNPATDYLTLQLGEYITEELFYRLTDLEGRQMNKAQILQEKTLIDVSTLPVATYFLHVFDKENKTIQSFKLIKK